MADYGIMSVVEIWIQSEILMGKITPSSMADELSSTVTEDV